MKKDFELTEKILNNINARLEPRVSVVESSALLGGFLTAEEALRAGYVLAMKLMQSDIPLDEEEHNACYIFTHDRDGKPTMHDAT